MSDEFGPPQDRAAEVAVLAAAFASPVATEAAGKILTGRDFYRPEHEEIWKAITGLRAARQAVDHVTLGDRLRSIDGPMQGPALALLPDLVTSMALPEGVEHHAEIVRDCAIRRRVIDLATGYRQRAYSPSEPATGLLDAMVRDVVGVREAGAPDVETLLLGEMLDEPEEPYDWVVPGLLERMDRLVLTGTEGLGKSTLMRQLGIYAAAGADPFRPKRRFSPRRVHFIECENTKRHTRRKIRAIVAKARQIGDDPANRVFFDFRPEGMDLMRDKDASWLHRALDATQPDLVMIGPLYKLFPRAINSDDDAAPAIAALDAIRNRGVALVVEAHSGHSKSASGRRDVRPRGSSALMGWPEFGYGLAPHSERDLRQRYGAAELVPWRGDRDERQWPRELGRGGFAPWTDLSLHRNEEAA